MSKITKKLKDYFNAQEVNDFLTLRFTSIMSDRMLKEWTERGNLSKEETTQLKYLSTYSKKFFELVSNRLNVKEIEKINKRLAKFDFRIVDDYMLQKINRDMNDKLKYATMPREQFDSFCEEIMDVRCKGCTQSWDTCELHDVFENNMAPEPTGYEKTNCRYAYDETVKFQGDDSRTVLRIK